MSHWLQKPFKPVKASLRDFPEWEDYLLKKTDERVLIVDDICDSGETFHKIKSYIKGPRLNQPMELPSRGSFCILWWNNECDFEPHYYAGVCERYRRYLDSFSVGTLVEHLFNFKLRRSTMKRLLLSLVAVVFATRFISKTFQ